MTVNRGLQQRILKRELMANYYHAARAHVRRLKELSEDSKRRAERRAELTSAQVLSSAS